MSHQERLHAFGYKDVTLTDGPFGFQALEARAFYLGLSEDSLLQGFRIRAGLPAPGKPMGGWYDPDGFAGAHPFGQYVSALARMYASTGDVRFKNKVSRLVHGFRETLAPDGFFYSSQKVFKEWPCYLYDKNCIGMRDAYTLTGNREALIVLSRMTDWAVKNLPRRSDEWYTLPENLYECFALTGEHRYLDLAKEYDYSQGYYDLFAKGTNALTPNRHAYSHINSLCSAAKIYESNGDKKYLSAIEQAWTYLTVTQMYASGGWGPDERFVEAGKGMLAKSLNTTDQGFETPCGSYANVNLDRYLIRFTGNAKYGDNMERVMYNGILAALPPHQDGHTFYYSSYRPGANKIRRSDLWTCCSGTYAQITADYPLDIYLHSSNDLYVNLYLNSNVRWLVARHPIEITQTTNYPDRLSSRFVVSTDRPAKFAMRFRVPHWTSGPVVIHINGRTVTDARVASQFVRIERTWRNGDVATLDFPTRMRFEPIDPQNPNLVALMRGPVLMVALADKEVALQGDRANPGSWIKPVDDARDFMTADRKVRFRPFYLVRDEKYTTYCRIDK